MKRYLILVAAYLLSGLLPLLVQVGSNFEYEYTLLASWYALFLIPLLALVLPDKYLDIKNKKFHKSKTVEFYWIFLISPIIVPLIAGIAFWTNQCNCSQTGYLFWMTVIWYPAWILAHAIHHLIIAGRVRGKQRSQLALAYAGVIGLVVFFLAISFWFNPQKRSLDLFAGFIHGPIYDSWIVVDAGIIWARGAHFFAASLLLSIAWYQKSRLNITAIAATAALWLTCSMISTNFDTVTTGKASLDRLMPGIMENEGFTLHYLPKMTPEEKVKPPSIKIKRIFREAKFHTAEIKEIFKESEFPHVEIYVYPNQTLKKLWFGAGATDVTDIHTPSIHITTAGWNHPTLRHELVHALSSGFGYKGLGFHPNIAFTEGLAVALAPVERSITLDDGAAAVLEAKRISNVQNLFSPYFWKESGARAYTVAGSMIRFLIEKYGFDGVKANYSGKSWEESFGGTKKQITSLWKRDILKKFDKKKFEVYTEALYRHPGILRSVCPHSKADLRRVRENNPFVRIRQPIGWNPKEDYWNWRQSLNPSDMSNRLVSWRKEIKEAVKDIARGGNRLLTWQQALKGARNDPPTVLEDIEIAILESDVLKQLGKPNESIQLLETLIEFSKENYLSDSITREIYTRFEVEKLGTEKSLNVRSYLAGWNKKLPAGLVGSEPWILSYLRIRNRRKEKISFAILKELATRKPQPNLPKTFQLEWNRFIAYRFMDYEKYSDAVKSWKMAAKAAPKSKKAALEENYRKSKFYALEGPFNSDAKTKKVKTEKI